MWLIYQSKPDKAMPAQQKKREFGGAFPMHELPSPPSLRVWRGIFVFTRYAKKVQRPLLNSGQA